MDEEWEVGSHWMSEVDDVIRINKISESEVSFCLVKEQGNVYKTSKLVFKLFYRKLEPEEEGLMLLGSLDK
jgi:hypothetical protein